MKALYVMRGLPGSGKSTAARRLLESRYDRAVDGAIFSTDDFFLKDGQYQFNPAQLATAHLWNQKRALLAMIEAKPLLVIDNTCTCAWEARDYVKPALLLGYEVTIVEPQTSWAFDAAECARRTSHGVPLETIEAMLQRWERDVGVEQILAALAPWERHATHTPAA